MRAGGATLTEIRRSEARVPTTVKDVRDSERVAEPKWQDWVSLLVTSALFGYGCYLAWTAGDKLLHVIMKPGSPDIVVIALAIQVVAPFLPPLVYLGMWLSAHRDPPWLLSPTVLCALGLLIAVIEVCGHALG
jgi:hypothetical protein